MLFACKEEWRDAKACFTDSIRIYESINHDNEVKMVLDNMAYMFYNMNEYSMSLYCYEELAVLAEKSNDDVCLGKACAKMSHLLVLNGDVPNALELIHKSIGILEKAGEIELLEQSQHILKWINEFQ